MDISETVLCLFSGEINRRDDSYVIEIPEREMRLGDIEQDIPYRIAVISHPKSRTDSGVPSHSIQEDDELGPPVTEGDHRTVDIEAIGDQGDGIARVERGYVIIVPDTEPNERVEIEITSVTETVAFGEVTERGDYYE